VAAGDIIFSRATEDGTACEIPCCVQCPTTDLDLVITGGECTFSCIPNQDSINWLSGTAPLAGGWTLTHSTPAPGVELYSATFPLGELQLYNDAACEEFAGDILGSTLEISVSCREPAVDGKKFRLGIAINTLAFQRFSLYATPEDEPFGLDEEVIIETACGTFSIILSEP